MFEENWNSRARDFNLDFNLDSFCSLVERSWENSVHRSLFSIAVNIVFEFFYINVFAFCN